jgi:hypothetical protein
MCRYFDAAEQQPDEAVRVCECGHMDDEHNDDRECEAEVEES